MYFISIQTNITAKINDGFDSIIKLFTFRLIINVMDVFFFQNTSKIIDKFYRDTVFIYFLVRHSIQSQSKYSTKQFCAPIIFFSVKIIEKRLCRYGITNKITVTSID